MDKKNIKHTLMIMALVMATPVKAMTLNGFTDYGSIIKINARTSGLVKNIKVTQGQQIKKGDVLIELDGVLQKETLKRAKAIEKSLFPGVEMAQLELDRAFELYDRDSLSQVELKKAENEFARAQGEYEAAQSDTAIAHYHLKNTKISAPVSGRVIDIHVSKAHYVDPSTNDVDLITLVDEQTSKAVTSVNAEQWSPVLLNKEATVEYKNTKYNGKVAYIDYKGIKQGDGTSTYEIHILFKSDTLIPAGMPVLITISD